MSIEPRALTPKRSTTTSLTKKTSRQASNAGDVNLLGARVINQNFAPSDTFAAIIQSMSKLPTTTADALAKLVGAASNSQHATATTGGPPSSGSPSTVGTPPATSNPIPAGNPPPAGNPLDSGNPPTTGNQLSGGTPPTTNSPPPTTGPSTLLDSPITTPSTNPAPATNPPPGPPGPGGHPSTGLDTTITVGVPVQPATQSTNVPPPQPPPAIAVPPANLLSGGQAIGPSVPQTSDKLSTSLDDDALTASPSPVATPMLGLSPISLGLAPAAASAANTSLPTQNIPLQIIQQLPDRMTWNGSETTLVMHLDPPELGPVYLRIVAGQRQGIQVHFRVEKEGIASTVSAGWSQLADALRSRGLSPESFSIALSSTPTTDLTNGDMFGPNSGQAGAQGDGWASAPLLVGSLGSADAALASNSHAETLSLASNGHYLDYRL